MGFKEFLISSRIADAKRDYLAKTSTNPNIVILHPADFRRLISEKEDKLKLYSPIPSFPREYVFGLKIIVSTSVKEWEPRVGHILCDAD